MELSNLDCWVLARSINGYKYTEPKGEMSRLAYNLLSVLENINMKDRDTILRNKLSAEEYRRISAVDTESGEPRDYKPVLPQNAEVLAVSQSWYIVPAHDLPKLPPVTWLIDSEIPERGLTLLYGASGSAKSFLALDYALRVAQHSPVLYGAFEGESGYPARIAAWTKQNKQSTGKLFMCLGFVEMMNDSQLNTFIASCHQIKPKLIVIDTMAMSMIGSDENSTRDMGMYIKTCKRLIAELDCSVLLLHHTNKGGQAERGSSALRGACDMMIRLSLVDDIIFKECSKSKDSKPFETQAYHLIPTIVEINNKPEESAILLITDKVAKSPIIELTSNQRKVLETLAMPVFAEGADMPDLVESSGLPRGSLYRIISRLMSDNLIRQVKRSRYVLTKEGGKMIGHTVESIHSSNESLESSASNQAQMNRLNRLNHIEKDKQIALGSDESPIQPIQTRQKPLLPEVKTHYSDGY